MHTWHVLWGHEIHDIVLIISYIIDYVGGMSLLKDYYYVWVSTGRKLCWDVSRETWRVDGLCKKYNIVIILPVQWMNTDTYMNRMYFGVISYHYWPSNLHCIIIYTTQWNTHKPTHWCSKIYTSSYSCNVRKIVQFMQPWQYIIIITQVHQPHLGQTTPNQTKLTIINRLECCILLKSRCGLSVRLPDIWAKNFGFLWPTGATFMGLLVTKGYMKAWPALSSLGRVHKYEGGCGGR